MFGLRIAKGAFKLDPLTGKYTNYAEHPGKANYDIASDEEDKVWVSKPGGNVVEIVDSHSGKIDDLALDAVVSQDYEVTAKDRELSAGLGLTPNTATPLEKGPRRSAADRGNDLVWVCEFFADRLAKIDARTKKVTEYPLPYRFSQPLLRDCEYQRPHRVDHHVEFGQNHEVRSRHRKIHGICASNTRHGNSPHPGGQQHESTDCLASV